MGQLNTEQCVLVVEIYHRTKSFLKVKEAFYEQYPDTEVPSKSTIQRKISHYRVWKYKIAHNLCVTDAKDTKFTPQQNIREGNIFWNFGENPTWWRHFLSRHVIFLFSWQKCWRQQKIFAMNQLFFIFSRKLYKSFHLRG